MENIGDGVFGKSSWIMSNTDLCHAGVVRFLLDSGKGRALTMFASSTEEWERAGGGFAEGDGRGGAGAKVTVGIRSSSERERSGS